MASWKSLAPAAALAVAVTGLVPTAASSAPPAHAGSVVPGQYVVVLEAAADPDAVVRDHGRRHGAEALHVYRAAVRGYAARMSAQAAARVAADPRVLSVEPDRVVTVAGAQRAAAASAAGEVSVQGAQPVPTGVDRVDGELSSTAAGDGSGTVDVDVAVIDTGIDVDHPDLTVVGGRNCSTGASYDDGNGHGTHVAGTIGAKDDASGVVGVAPGARLWAVRVLNNRGSGTTSSVICGIDWVTTNAATIEVANMSLGGAGTDSACGAGDAYHDAVCRSVAAGVTYAVAAGNSAADSSGYRPATYEEVITVSALADFDGRAGGGAAATCRSDVDDTLADFSNYGADVDLIAPGVCITSTWPGGGDNTISGTSMASPHVAGAAALYLARNPGVTPSEVKSALQSAGTTEWDAADDKDSTKERLLNVAGF